MRKCTNLDKLCFDYFLMFKDFQTHEYENVQPLDEIHMGNGFFQPPVIGRSQVTRHAAYNYKSFDFYFKSISSFNLFPHYFLLLFCLIHLTSCIKTRAESVIVCVTGL